jgi:hypothetical protein
MRVVRKNVGFSVGNIDFSYEIQIHSLSPLTGSKFGGTTLTITG